MEHRVNIRRFTVSDAVAVRELFIRVNRFLAPAHLKESFENYIKLSLYEEIGRISAYYDERKGSFWIASIGNQLVGMFGLENFGPDALELRRMYVDPDFHRRGIGTTLLKFAEDHCRAHNVRRLELSTSETQPAALSLYRDSGFELVREEIAETANNKTIGEGIRRFYFKKDFF